MEASSISIVTKLLNSKCMGTSQDQDDGRDLNFSTVACWKFKVTSYRQ